MYVVLQTPIIAN